MAINRTPYNALVDDDGTNTTGSIWNKSAIATVILDPADAAYAPFTSRCRAYSNQLTAVTTATITAIPLMLEDYDPAGQHDLVTNNSRVTIPVTGGYLIVGLLSYAPNASGARYVQVRNSGGTTMAQGLVPGSTVTVLTLVATPPLIVALTAGEYLTLNAYQDSGSTLNVGDTSNVQQMSALTVVRLW